MDQVEAVVNFTKKFDITEYLCRKSVNGLALIGAYYLAHEFLYTPLRGFWAHFLRPRRNLLKRYGEGSWALVTGASDGIGEQLCYELARSGLNIVLVSRTKEKLDTVATKIKNDYNVKTVVIQYDFSVLSTPEEADKLTKLIEDNTKDLDISVLVNNVGLAWAGTFHTVPLQKMFNMLIINCSSQLVLTRHFLSRWANTR